MVIHLNIDHAHDYLTSVIWTSMIWQFPIVTHPCIDHGHGSLTFMELLAHVRAVL